MQEGEKQKKKLDNWEITWLHRHTTYEHIQRFSSSSGITNAKPTTTTTTTHKQAACIAANGCKLTSPEAARMRKSLRVQQQQQRAAATSTPNCRHVAAFVIVTARYESASRSAGANITLQL